MKSIVLILFALLFFPPQAMSSKSDHDTLYKRCFNPKYTPDNLSSRCYDIGNLYYNGGTKWVKSKYGDLGPPKSHTRAFKFYQEACDMDRGLSNRGLSKSCNKVSEMYSIGDGIRKDLEKAFQYADRSCHLQNPSDSSSSSKGCSTLAQMYINGNGVKADDYMVAKTYLHDCQINGNAPACKQAFMYGNYNCNNGHVDSCVAISMMYKQLKPEYYDKENADNAAEKANEYLQKACKLGASRSCAGVAVNYSKTDINKTIKYLKLACEGKPSVMCGFLSNLYLEGEGIKKNHSSSLKYAKIGCGHADGLSCAVIGMQYGKGLGLTENTSEALKYFIKACKLDHTASCRVSTSLYLNGIGTKKIELKL